MRISGKLIIKVGLGALAALTAVSIYQEYKEIRKEEEEHIKDLEERGDFDYDAEEPSYMETGEAVKKAAKKFGKDIKNDLLYGEGWKVVAVGVGLGVVSNIFYVAGRNDCFDRMEGEAKKNVTDAFVDGSMFGFASGRCFMGDHIEASNPENADKIMDNLDNWEKLYAGTDKMKWRAADSWNDPRITEQYNFMRENVQVLN